MKNPVTKETIWEAAPESLDISLNELDHIPDADDSIEFHSARIMLLIYFAGGERAKRIDGRTKLAKLDFFVRYPAFLAQAAHLKGVPNTINVKVKPDSKMIRYKYGPWDAKYYDIFAYLVAKDFLNITPDSKKGTIFSN